MLGTKPTAHTEDFTCSVLVSKVGVCAGSATLCSGPPRLQLVAAECAPSWIWRLLPQHTLIIRIQFLVTGGLTSLLPAGGQLGAALSSQRLPDLPARGPPRMAARFSKTGRCLCCFWARNSQRPRPF